MEPEVRNALDAVREHGHHLLPDEYVTYLEDLIEELEIELDAAKDGA